MNIGLQFPIDGITITLQSPYGEDTRLPIIQSHASYYLFKLIQRLSTFGLIRAGERSEEHACCASKRQPVRSYGSGPAVS